MMAPRDIESKITVRVRTMMSHLFFILTSGEGPGGPGIPGVPGEPGVPEGPCFPGGPAGPSPPVVDTP